MSRITLTNDDGSTQEFVPVVVPEVLSETAPEIVPVQEAEVVSEDANTNSPEAVQSEVEPE